MAIARHRKLAVIMEDFLGNFPDDANDLDMLPNFEFPFGELLNDVEPNVAEGGDLLVDFPGQSSESAWKAQQTPQTRKCQSS